MLSWSIMRYTENWGKIWLLSEKNGEVWKCLVAVKYVTTDYELLFCLKECFHWMHYLAFHRLCLPTCLQCMPSTMGHRGWRKLERVYTTVPWFWRKVSDYSKKKFAWKDWCSIMDLCDMHIVSVCDDKLTFWWKERLRKHCICLHLHGPALTCSSP